MNLTFFKIFNYFIKAPFALHHQTALKMQIILGKYHYWTDHRPHFSLFGKISIPYQRIAISSATKLSLSEISFSLKHFHIIKIY